MTTFIKGISTYAIGNITVQLLNFLLIPIYIRYLNIEEFGFLSILEMVFFMSNIFFTMSLEKSCQRFYYDKNLYFGKKVFSIIFYLLLILGGILLFILNIDLFSNLISTNLNLTNSHISLILLASFFYAFSLIGLAKLQVTERIFHYTLFQLTKALLLIISTSYFIIYKELTLLGYIYSILSVYSVLFICSLYIIKPKITYFLIPFKYIKEIFYFSLPYIPIVLSAWIFAMAGRLILNNYKTIEDVALYSIAYKVSMGIIVITSSVIAYVTPKVFNILSSDKINYLELKVLYKSSDLVFKVFIIIIFLILPEIFTYILTEEYIQGLIYVIPLLIVNYISACMGISLNLYFSFYKYNVLLMLIYILTSSIYIFISLYFVENYGIWAIAVSSLSTVLLMAFLQFIYLRDKNRVNINILELYRNSFVLLILGLLIIEISTNISGNLIYILIFLKIIIIIYLINFLINKLKNLD